MPPSLPIPPHIVRRIMKELASAREDADITHLTIQPTAGDEDISQLKASFPGPGGTPYEGGTFWVDIKIPPEYPFKPPAMKFLTRIWHPNVSSQTGTICLDTLGKAWSPILTLKSALISLQSLLSTPEPRDPQDAEVAKMLLSNPSQFERVARDWTARYADGPASSKADAEAGASAADEAPAPEYHGFDAELVQQFCAMGFAVPRVVRAFMDEGIPRGSLALSTVQSNNIAGRLLGE